MPYKKLIETIMPVAFINSESEREKTARGGMPNSVHIWWSRRPMAAARSTLFASLVDDPGEHPECFLTEEAQKQERQRLIQMTAELSSVENAVNDSILEAARKEILRYTEETAPTVYDPFVGSGTIPVEAHRLGLNTEAADLNAVAVLMTSAVSDIPTRFENSIPIHPREDMTLDIPLSGAHALAEDVRWYGEWIQKEAERIVNEAKEEHHKMVKGSIQEEDIALDIINMDLIQENIIYNANINRHKGRN